MANQQNGHSNEHPPSRPPPPLVGKYTKNTYISFRAHAHVRVLHLTYVTYVTYVTHTCEIKKWQTKNAAQVNIRNYIIYYLF